MNSAVSSVQLTIIPQFESLMLLNWELTLKESKKVVVIVNWKFHLFSIIVHFSVSIFVKEIK